MLKLKLPLLITYSAGRSLVSLQETPEGFVVREYTLKPSREDVESLNLQYIEQDFATAKAIFDGIKERATIVAVK